MWFDNDDNDDFVSPEGIDKVKGNNDDWVIGVCVCVCVCACVCVRVRCI